MGLKIFGKKLKVPDPGDLIPGGGGGGNPISGAVNTVTGAASDAAAVPEHVIEEVIDAVKRELPDLVDAALEELLKVISSQLLARAAKIYEFTVPDEVEISVGPFGLVIADIHDKIDAVGKWINHPPTSKDGVRQCISEIGPTSVSITLSAELALLVVSSDSLAVGCKLVWSVEAFLERLDDIWEAL